MTSNNYGKTLPMKWVGGCGGGGGGGGGGVAMISPSKFLNNLCCNC